MNTKHTIEQLTEYFEFLDELRESGVTNMFGAGAYVERQFLMGRNEAGDVLQLWMNTFGDESPSVRAAKATHP